MAAAKEPPTPSVPAATAPARERASGPREPEGFDGPVLPVVLAVGLPASVAAGAAMALTLSAIAEISSEPTAVPGIDSSTWTPLTGIASFVLGLDAFHGSFHVLPILFGLATHLATAIAFGLVGVWFILVTQGTRPGAIGAPLQGLAYALFLQVFFLNLVVGAIQDVHSVYESLPEWGWWVAHGVYGATLGLAVSKLLAGGRTPAEPGP